jgi:hypothetical protein
MSTAKTILGIVPGMMALDVVGKTIPNTKSFGKKSKKKQSIMPKGFFHAIVGVPMIGAVSTEINKLD